MVAGLALSCQFIPMVFDWENLINQIPLSAAFVVFAAGYVLGRQRGPRQEITAMPEDAVAPPQAVFKNLDYSSIADEKPEPEAKGKGVLRFISRGLEKVKKMHSVKFWEPKVEPLLLHRLLQDPKLHRKRSKTSVHVHATTKPTTGIKAHTDEYKKTLEGVHVYESEDATSLKDKVLDPLLAMRGLDVLQTEAGGETSIGTHPLFIA